MWSDSLEQDGQISELHTKIHKQLRAISHPFFPRAVEREDPGAGAVQRSTTMLPTGTGLSMWQVSGVTCGIGQSSSPCPLSLPAGEINSLAVLAPHQPQLLIAWQNLKGRAALKLFAVTCSLKAMRCHFISWCETATTGLFLQSAWPPCCN